MAAGQNLLLNLILRLRDEASQGLNNARARVRELGQEVERLGPLDNAVKNTFLNIKAYILSAFAIAGIAQFSNKLIETIRVAQDLGLRLSGLTKSAMDYAASQVYLIDLSARYHKSITTLTGSYAAFLALENAGVITRQQSIQLLQGFSNAATKTGASQDQMAQSTYGLAQALGTGIVAMEEFKQITEPMPGLANEIAKAFGMTVGELRVLIGTGTVASEVFGRKFVIALKAYEGASERAGGTISASYADIGNAYNEMAKALEKPVATGLLNLVDVGKSAYGWIKDNSSEIVTVLELIAVTLSGKVLSSLSAVTAGYVTRYQAETRTRASAIALAEADAALAAGNVALAQSNLVLVQGDLRAETAKLSLANATVVAARAQVEGLQAQAQTIPVTHLLRQAEMELAAVESSRSAVLANMAALGRQQAAVSAQITAAQAAQTESTLVLSAATSTASVAMGRAAAAGKAAFSFVGGWVGVAVIALYGLYTVLEKVTGSEEKAATKAKAFADALALSNAEVKKLSEKEVDIDFTKTEGNIDAVTKKIKDIEKFSWGKILNLGDLAAQRENLTQTLDVLKKRKDALIAQKNERIINFDASALSASELSSELENTKAKIIEITNRVEPLKQQVADGFLSRDAINGDLLLLNAYEAKLSALQAATGAGSQSQQQLKKAFKDAQEASKEQTANIDADTKMQTAAIEQGLTERLAAIDAMNIGEAQKDTQRLTAKLQAADLELQIQQTAVASKLALIDQEYKAELAGAANNATRTREIETQKRQDKLAVYTGLAEYYQGEVNRLSGVYASELQSARQAKQQLQNLDQSHEQALFNIKLMGMTEREKLDAEQSRFNELTRNIEEEQAKGAAADQEKIKGWLTEAKGLHADITTAAKDSAEAQSDARSRINKLFTLEQKSLEDNAEYHENNAKRAKKAQESVAEKLGETQKIIANIAEQLNKEYALKIGIDSASLTAAQTTIADLTKSETKTITIKTVNSGGGGGDAPAQQSTGGPAGQPTGEPWRFATGGTVGDLIRRFSTGGHTPMAGKLPGFGGGDKIKALLEPGEFIVRKEAVKKAGIPFLEHLNQFGEAPAGDVIRRATGGLVDAAKMRRDSASAARAAERKAARDRAADELLNLAKSTVNLSRRDTSNIEAMASGGSDRWDKTIWAQLTTQADAVMQSSGLPGDAVTILRAAADDYQAHGAGATLSQAKEMIRVMVENQTIAEMQAQADNSPALPTLGNSASSSSGNSLLPSLGGTKPFADIAAKLQAQSRSISLPMPSIPSVPSAQASGGVQGSTTKIQFVSPKGETANGHFGESDATAILRVLKDAGARTA